MRMPRLALLTLWLFCLPVFAGCVAVYDEDDPAVEKAQALYEDASALTAMMRTNRERLAALPEDETTAAMDADLAYAEWLSRAMAVVADSLRRDLLNEPPDAEADADASTE